MNASYKGLLEEYERPDYAKANAKYRTLLKTAIDRQSGKPQAILKITGFLSSAEKMGNHIDYITRNGSLELTDQEGFSFQEKGEHQANIEDWAVDFTPVVKKQSDTKMSLRVNADDEKDVRAVYDALKAFGQDNLQDVAWRVDKSRSKQSPTLVTLRVTATSKTAGIVREKLEGFEHDALSAFTTQLEEVAGRLPRNAMKMALSSPEGSKPKSVIKAAEAFAKKAFGDEGYRYLYALHTDTNNPHVHLVVKMVNEQGKRLTTDKPDLYRWRELWAEMCQEQGIDVVAVPNYMRGVSSGKVPDATQMARMKSMRTAQPDSVSHYQETIRNVVNDAIHKGHYTATQREIAAIKRNLQTRQEYLDAAHQLRSEVGKIEDHIKQKQLIMMAAILEKEAKALPIPKTKVQQMLETEGKKLGISIRTLLPKDVVEQLRSAFKSIDLHTKERGAMTTKHGPEPGVETEIDR